MVDRKIIQICTDLIETEEDPRVVLHALCDDGSVWIKEGRLFSWKRVDDLVPEIEEGPTP